MSGLICRQANAAACIAAPKDKLAEAGKFAGVQSFRLGDNRAAKVVEAITLSWDAGLEAGAYRGCRVDWC